MRGKTLIVHFILVGFVSGYISTLGLLMLDQPEKPSPPSFLLWLIAPLFFTPFFCFLTLPSAAILAGLFYLLRRHAAHEKSELTEVLICTSFIILTGVCGFISGMLFHVGLGSSTLLIGIVTAVGAFTGLADYFVWRNAFDSLPAGHQE